MSRGSSQIHVTAIVDPGAELGAGVEVGAYAIIGPGVRIGAGCRIGAAVQIQGPTVIGERNTIAGPAALGFPPQDVKYRGGETRLEIGSDNLIREFTTFSRGTEKGGGVTRVGDHNFIMAYAHIAHDCQVGSQTVFANAATLAGHVEIGDHATVGAFSAVHQFCRVGNYAFIGGFTVATKDVLPYSKTAGNHAKTYGMNTIGLERNGFSEERLAPLKKAYRLLFQSKLNTTQALTRMRSEVVGSEDVDYLMRFIAESQRGVVK